MNEPFQVRVKQVVETLPGWCSPEKAIKLCDEIEARRPDRIVEIGVYGGRSLIPLAMACQEIDHGVCVGIDPWDARASIEGYDGDNATWWGRLDHQQIYDGFIEATRRLNLAHRIAVVRQKSDDAMLVHDIGMLHIDGAHTEQAVRDVLKWAPYVVAGGMVVMDDTGWANGHDQPVMRAVGELIRLGFRQLYELGTGAVFERAAAS